MDAEPTPQPATQRKPRVRRDVHARLDYVSMVEKLGGQAIPLGRTRGSLDVFWPGEAPDAAARLRATGSEK